MNLYSFECKGCGESIKAPYELPKSMAWENAVVVVPQLGSLAERAETLGVTLHAGSAKAYL